MLMTVSAQFGPAELSNVCTKFRKSHCSLWTLTFLGEKDPSVKEITALFSATNINLSSMQACFNKTRIGRMSRASGSIFKSRVVTKSLKNPFD